MAVYCSTISAKLTAALYDPPIADKAHVCVAVYCSVLQCVAVCCSVLQCVAACCSKMSAKLTAGMYAYRMCYSTAITPVPSKTQVCVALRSLCCSAKHTQSHKVDMLRHVRVLQCVTVCYSVLQCVTVCCSVLQCVAVCYSMLQCVTVCYSVLRCVALCYSVLHCVAVWYSVLQCVAVCCSVMHLTRWTHVQLEGLLSGVFGITLPAQTDGIDRFLKPK